MYPFEIQSNCVRKADVEAIETVLSVVICVVFEITPANSRLVGIFIVKGTSGFRLVGRYAVGHGSLKPI